jgi:hypothetical protein
MQMEKLIKELKELFTFKNSTREGDIVLIAAENPPLLVYGLVTAISRDDSKRDEWWHVSLQMLTIPPQKTVWTLREAQFTGREVFTMGGQERFITSLDFSEPGKPSPETSPGKGRKGELRVLK